MKSLAIKRKSSEAVPNVKDLGESYPSLCLYDQQVKAFTDGFKLEPGKTYSAEIQFKVTGWRDNGDSKSLDISITDAGDIEEEGDAEEESADEEGDGVMVAVMGKKG